MTLIDILKIQRPLYTNDPENPRLVYNKNRTVQFQTVQEGLEDGFSSQYATMQAKYFARCELVKQGPKINITVLEVLPDQGW